MSEQLIISVGREFGSGGHVIAEALAERFGLPLHDYHLLKEIAAEKGLNAAELEKYDEVPKNMFLSRRVGDYSNSPQEHVAKMQFDYLREKAARGESFVVVGRCSEAVLKEYHTLISIFVLADMPAKVKRIAELKGVSELEAEAKIARHDKTRKRYHNYFCNGKWGDSRNYDISINSTRLGIDGTVDMLEAYIRERIKENH